MSFMSLEDRLGGTAPKRQECAREDGELPALLQAAGNQPAPPEGEMVVSFQALED